MQNPEAKEDKKEKKPKDIFRELIDREEYLLKKRLPAKLPRRKNDVYVSRKTNFQAQLERCQRLLDSGNEVFVHGLGTAINRAINLALQLKERGLGTVEVATHTSTVELVDDLEPETDELEQETQTRHNSAVHIRVYRKEVQEMEQP
ncbi:ribonuclease P protein subunit p20-like [Littorina saxatilis]|uniref:Ribonuclease P protein subunit p20 n=1 Tax=Littorina saxatilis TaxID=31220 RepID=A0AAN9BE72_9CAEN